MQTINSKTGFCFFVHSELAPTVVIFLPRTSTSIVFLTKNQNQLEITPKVVDSIPLAADLGAVPTQLRSYCFFSATNITNKKVLKSIFNIKR